MTKNHQKEVPKFEPKAWRGSRPTSEGFLGGPRGQFAPKAWNTNEYHTSRANSKEVLFPGSGGGGGGLGGRFGGRFWSKKAIGTRQF